MSEGVMWQISFQSIQKGTDEELVHRGIDKWVCLVWRWSIVEQEANTDSYER